MKCPDSDTLVTIGSAVDWNVVELLEHLRSCETCEAHLQGLATIHGALEVTEQPNPIIIMDIVAEMKAVSVRRDRFLNAVSMSLTPVLAGLTAFFAAASGHASLNSSGLAAAVVAVATLAWTTAPRTERVNG